MDRRTNFFCKSRRLEDLDVMPCLTEANGCCKASYSGPCDDNIQRPRFMWNDSWCCHLHSRMLGMAPTREAMSETTDLGPREFRGDQGLLRLFFKYFLVWATED
jgi:hypothetical protein